MLPQILEWKVEDPSLLKTYRAIPDAKTRAIFDSIGSKHHGHEDALALLLKDGCFDEFVEALLKEESAEIDAFIRKLLYRPLLLALEDAPSRLLDSLFLHLEATKYDLDKGQKVSRAHALFEEFAGSGSGIRQLYRTYRDLQSARPSVAGPSAAPRARDKDRYDVKESMLSLLDRNFHVIDTEKALSHSSMSKLIVVQGDDDADHERFLRRLGREFPTHFARRVDVTFPDGSSSRSPAELLRTAINARLKEKNPLVTEAIVHLEVYDSDLRRLRLTTIRFFDALEAASFELRELRPELRSLTLLVMYHCNGSAGRNGAFDALARLFRLAGATDPCKPIAEWAAQTPPNDVLRAHLYLDPIPHPGSVRAWAREVRDHLTSEYDDDWLKTRFPQFVEDDRIPYKVAAKACAELLE